MTTSYTQSIEQRPKTTNTPERKKKSFDFWETLRTSIKRPPFVFGSGNKIDGVIGLFVNAEFVRNFI
jgi:hypothetical protein